MTEAAVKIVTNSEPIRIGLIIQPNADYPPACFDRLVTLFEPIDRLVLLGEGRPCSDAAEWLQARQARERVTFDRVAQ